MLPLLAASRRPAALLPAGEPPTADRSAVADDLNHTAIGYIHVGKTAGTTVMSWLQAAGINFKEYHTKGAPTLADIRAHKKWVVSVRDPISRLNSCFYYQRPDSKIPGGFKDGAWSRAFYALQGGCFKHFKDYAKALGENETACGKLARASLSERELAEHLSKSYRTANDGSRHFSKVPRPQPRPSRSSRPPPTPSAPRRPALRA